MPQATTTSSLAGWLNSPSMMQAEGRCCSTAGSSAAYTHWADMSRRWALAAIADAAVVFVFVIAGRNEHNTGSDLAGFVSVAGPFVIGATVGWGVLARRRSDPCRMTSGIIVWASTLVIGLILRRLLTDGGTATAFVAVATGVLALGMIGWRAVWTLRHREPVLST